MILNDVSGVVIARAVDYSTREKVKMDVPLLRVLALNAIMDSIDKVRKYADEVVLCIDAKNYWRKDVFPLYKANRAASQKKDPFDWDALHAAFNVVKEEFKANLPYKYVEVDRAEADDVISVLALTMAPHRDVVIVSNDNDFLQLQSINPKIKQ